MGWTGWLALAVALPALAVLATLALWSLRLWIGFMRRGDLPPYGHPDPLPLPDHVRADLARVRRRVKPAEPEKA